MADVISAVRTYLLTKSAITDLIGQRIYFDVLPQKATLPAVTLSKLSEQHHHTISDRAGLTDTRISLECYSSRRLDANAIATAVIGCGIAAIKGTYSTIDIRGVAIEEGQRNFIEQDTSGGDDHRYVTTFDLMVNHLS